MPNEFEHYHAVGNSWNIKFAEMRIKSHSENIDEKFMDILLYYF